jgi:hypothetical protein
MGHAEEVKQEKNLLVKNKFEYIISLGQACCPRAFVDRFKLRKKFPIRMPFDGSGHSFEAICNLIKTDFDYNFEDPKVIKFNGTHYSHTMGILWQHEKTKDIDSLKIQIQKRAEQFKQTLFSSQNILFIIYFTHQKYNLDPLISIIEERYPHLNFKIFGFSHFKHEKYSKEKIGKAVYLNIPFTSDDFVAEMFKTEYGKEYASDVLIEICKTLEEDPIKYSLDEAYHFDNALDLNPNLKADK